MDTTISRVLKILAGVVVLGFVACGIHGANASSWDSCQQNLWSAAGAAALFTLLWVITDYNMRGRTRYTNYNNIVGMPIALLAVFATFGFVAAGIAAGFGGHYDTDLALIWGGTGTAWVLSLIWCITDYNCTN